jgi:hypothetical protein
MKINDLFNFVYPLKITNRGTNLNSVSRYIRYFLAVFFVSGFSLFASPDFKIRYNQKFPCLEVMDSKAEKITDVTEGAKGETVTSGKSSITISFSKNADGLPEAILSDAKSPLSEMEIEAFGLSVGLKPAGTVMVRFGADHKPSFVMDRTGGARFLMADLGNLDTAAGKEVAANTPPSKNLIRCRERLADWIAGKGGWSNKSGKILATEGDDRVKVGEVPNRAIQVGEAFQTGASITVGSKGPLLWQSGSGVFHLALPGTVFMIGKLEAGSPDLKVELVQGTLQTFVAQPLQSPRGSLIGVGDGVVARTLDASYQVNRGAGKEVTTTLTAISGKVILAEEAGGKEVAVLSGEQTLDGLKKGSVRDLTKNSPEKSSLVALQQLAKETTLIDIARDGVKACPEAAAEIISTAVKAAPDFAKKIAESCVRAQPKLVAVISSASGVSDLKLTKEEQAKVDALETLDRRLAQIQQDGIDLDMKLGQVLIVQGDVHVNGRKEALTSGQILNLKDKITTSKGGRVFVGIAPGVVLSVESDSTAVLEKMDAEIKEGQLQRRSAVVNSESGLVVLSIAPWNKEKTDVRVKTKEGESVAQGTVFAVNFIGGKMMTTVSRGQVSSTDASGKSVAISAGQQASPGATTAAATPANSVEAKAASNVGETASHVLAANVAASVAAALPTAAGEIAAIAAKAIPGAADAIAGAVAAKAPAAAMEIAQAVAKAVPEAADKVAAAVIAAAPGADSKAIASATAATAKAAAEASAVDTASGTSTASGGTSGGGGGSVGGGFGGAAIQQTADNQAQQLAAAQKALEEAQKALEKAKTDADKKAAQDKVNAATAELAKAKKAADDAAAAKVLADKAAADKAAADVAAAQAAADAKKAADDAAAAKALADADAKAKADAQLAADTAAANAKSAADAAAAAQALANQDAAAKALADAAAKKMADDAAIAAAAAKVNQEALAAELAANKKAEAEKTAAAKAAADAIKAAEEMQSALATQTKSQQDAAVRAAADAAAEEARRAADAASEAKKAADLAKGSANASYGSLSDSNKSLAEDYKKSSPAAPETAAAGLRRMMAAASVFSTEQLNANDGELKTFIENWDAYVAKQLEKFASESKKAEKAAASERAAAIEKAVTEAADENDAREKAAALIDEAQKAAAAKESARAAAADAAAKKAEEENTARLEREARVAAQKVADDAAAVAKQAAEAAAAAKALADVEAATKAAEKLAAEQTAAAAKKAAEDAAAAKALADVEAATKAAEKLAAEKTAAAAKKAAEDAAAAKLLAEKEAADLIAAQKEAERKKAEAERATDFASNLNG